MELEPYCDHILREGLGNPHNALILNADHPLYKEMTPIVARAALSKLEQNGHITYSLYRDGYFVMLTEQGVSFIIEKSYVKEKRKEASLTWPQRHWLLYGVFNLIAGSVITLGISKLNIEETTQSKPQNTYTGDTSPLQTSSSFLTQDSLVILKDHAAPLRKRRNK